ncbi:cytochrome P450 714A1-like [Rosa rugosa]|uniref:cytochrome P450 714A1-like n=1 Tax=Rosa rugosa TaxID=74645 RepID=UPI002B4031BF|nr:cytochrome P450 714A1-like [Rosa rugosa]
MAIALLLTALFVCISSLVLRALNQLWFKPRRIRSVLYKQGIRGPRPSFPFGNIPEMQSSIKIPSDAQQHVHHNWVPSIFPYLHKWEKKYGPIYMYSTGSKQHLYVSDPNLLRGIKQHNTLDLGKPTYLGKPLQPLLGDGIVRSNGQHWANQKKIIAPEFFLNKVMGMVGLMLESTMKIMKEWESRIQEVGEDSNVLDMSIDKDLKTLSRDIISRACFSSSYAQGNQIFEKISLMQEALSKPSLLFGFLNFRFLPFNNDKKIWNLRREVDAMLLEIVRHRQSGGGVHNAQKDLLQVLLESAAAANNGKHTPKTERFVLDNCRTIYFVGSETTSLTASWTLMLLSLHPEWQERLRAEIIGICGDHDRHELHRCLQDMDTLSKLKMLTMVIQESLRLYAPAVLTPRQALANMKLGDLDVPQDMIIWIAIASLHRDPKNWGPDANEFKPERFANGVTEACKFPNAYLPFGFGSRLCIGQTFAMMELKIVLSLLLSKFSFSLSPNYHHSPVLKMVLVPEHGINLLVRRV